MNEQELFDFAKEEHERQVTYYGTKGNPRTKYTMLAKIMEELGELSEAVLESDSLQRSSKLKGETDIANEIADVVITAFILGQELGIDNEKAISEKIEKIRKRKY